MSLKHLNHTFCRTLVSFRRNRQRYDVLIDRGNCVWEYEVDGKRRGMRMPAGGLDTVALRLTLPGVDKAIKDEWARADQADQMFRNPEAQ